MSARLQLGPTEVADTLTLHYSCVVRRKNNEQVMNDTIVDVCSTVVASTLASYVVQARLLYTLLHTRYSTGTQQYSCTAVGIPRCSST